MEEPVESESDKSDDPSEQNEELSEGAKLGRLRRLCERKPSGKLKVPENIHNMWKRGGHDRQELLHMLEEAGFEEDWCVLCLCVCLGMYALCN